MYALTAIPTEKIGVIEIMILNPQNEAIASVTTQFKDFRHTVEDMVGAFKNPIGVLIDGEVIVPDACSITEALETWFLSQYGYQPSEAELQAHPDCDDPYWDPIG